jgi:HPt (histidine-containing phosphotransfer) domain-containing protein
MLCIEATDMPIIDNKVLCELEHATNPALVTRVISKYLDEAAEDLRKAKAAADAGDIEALRKAAHSLSGSSSTVGAQRLQNLVASIEQYCIEGERDAALGIVHDLQAVGEATRGQFEKLARQRAA